MTKSMITKVRETVGGWHRYGFCPSDAVVKNFGSTGCSRWVVVLTFSRHGGSEDDFLTECDTWTEADALAAKVNKRINREWDKLAA